jgi:hypothetical protein
MTKILIITQIYPQLVQSNISMIIDIKNIKNSISYYNIQLNEDF